MAKFQGRGKQSWGDLAKSFDKMSGKSDNATDERFFVPGKDSEGNVAVTLRFLPSPDSSPVLEDRRHWIKGPGGKLYNEACPKVAGKGCPVCSFAGAAWGENDQDAYKKWGSSSKFRANIAVINDINKPENNGKVFLYKFGASIQKMIEAKLKPKSQLQTATIVMDYEEGLNFDLIGSKSSFRPVGSAKAIEFTDFKESAWQGADVSVLTLEQIESFDSQLHDMKEWTPDEQLESYDVLKSKWEDVMEITNGVSTASAEKVPDPSDGDLKALDALMKDGVNEEETKVVASEVTQSDDEEDDLMAQLKGITGDD